MDALFPEVTRFGSPSRPAESAAAILRVRASRSGVVLYPAMPVDLLAAAVTADAWSALLGDAALDDVRVHGPAATAVLAAALARAAGHCPEVVEVPRIECASARDLLLLAESHRAWAVELCPEAFGQVLVRAGSDLYAGGAGTRFAAYGSLLQMLADL